MKEMPLNIHASYSCLCVLSERRLCIDLPQIRNHLLITLFSLDVWSGALVTQSVIRIYWSRVAEHTSIKQNFQTITLP